MRFLVDESTGPKVSAWLVSHGHDVFCVYTEARGMGDDEVIRKAHEEGWILVTNDKDFGERVFRLHCPHQGVVLLRLEDERSVMKIEILRRLLAQHVERLSGRFVVATERRVRIIES